MKPIGKKLVGTDTAMLVSINVNSAIWNEVYESSSPEIFGNMPKSKLKKLISACELSRTRLLQSGQITIIIFLCRHPCGVHLQYFDYQVTHFQQLSSVQASQINRAEQF